MRISSKTELVNHPVRLQILGIFGRKSLTPKQIAVALPDVSQASLYRHLKVLHEAGLLEVVAQRQAHGIVESTYAVKKGAAHFTREEFAAMSPEEHRSTLAVLHGSASSVLSRYLRQPEFDTTNDGMTYFSVRLHLTQEEARQLRLDVLALVSGYAKEPDETRRAQHVTVSLIPDPEL